MRAMLSFCAAAPRSRRRSAGCKLVKNPDPAEDGGEGGGGRPRAVGAQTSPTMWTAKVLPHMNEAATEFATLQAAIAGGLDAAGAGARLPRQKQGLAVDTIRSRPRARWWRRRPTPAAATSDVDATATARRTRRSARPGDPRDDAARRAAFIDFTAFRDQIAFAELARGLNDLASTSALGSGAEGRAGGQEGDAGRGLHDEGAGRSDR